MQNYDDSYLKNHCYKQQMNFFLPFARHHSALAVSVEMSSVCGIDCFRALMFMSSKFGRKLPAINITQQDAELISRVNVELQQYIVNMDSVKYVDSVVLRHARVQLRYVYQCRRLSVTSRYHVKTMLIGSFMQFSSLSSQETLVFVTNVHTFGPREISLASLI